MAPDFSDSKRRSVTELADDEALKRVDAPEFGSQAHIQWYPGHIAKWDKALEETLKIVDVVIYVVDARIPRTTFQQSFVKRFRQKPFLIVLHKSLLADPAQTRQWVKIFQQEDLQVMALDSLAQTGTKSGGQTSSREILIQKLLEMGEPVQQRYLSKGMKRRPIRVLVAGMPNVGKSTLINHIVQRKKVLTGHKAGVTRQKQWIRIHPDLELLDSPGVIPPRIEGGQEAAFLLASVSSVGEAAFDDEQVTTYLIESINKSYPGKIQAHYHLTEDKPLSVRAIALARNWLLSQQEPDIGRSAQAILKDFRQGKLGRFSLEWPR